jgi:hypothetical protein
VETPHAFTESGGMADLDMEKLVISSEVTEKTVEAAVVEKEKTNKKNKKKKAAAVTEDVGEDVEIPAPASEAGEGPPACAYCGQADPTRRCAKRHPK